MMCPAGMGGWGMGVMMLGWLLVIAAIIVGVVLLVRYLGRSGTGGLGDGVDSAQRLLAERYARGDIDEQEYQQRLDVLRRGRGA